MGVFELDETARTAALCWWPTVADLPEVRSGVSEGKMFGVLLCHFDPSRHFTPSTPSSRAQAELPPGVTWFDRARNLVRLIAFSGQLAGVWERPNWAPSLLDHHHAAGLSWRAQRDLHRLSYALREAQAAGETERVRTLKSARRARSRAHAAELRALTRVTPLIGSPQSLSALWPDAATGVGECCAPKLLCWAGRLNLTPIGIAEFCILARRAKPPRALLLEERLTARGELLSFYDPCVERCHPLIPLIIGASCALVSD